MVYQGYVETQTGPVANPTGYVNTGVASANPQSGYAADQGLQQIISQIPQNANGVSPGVILSNILTAAAGAPRNTFAPVLTGGISSSGGPPLTGGTSYNPIPKTIIDITTPKGTGNNAGQIAQALGILAKPNAFTPPAGVGLATAPGLPSQLLPGFSAPSMPSTNAPVNFMPQANPFAPQQPGMPQAGGGGGVGPSGFGGGSGVGPGGAPGGTPFMNPSAIPGMRQAMAQPIAQPQAGLSSTTSGFAPGGAVAYNRGPGGQGAPMPSAAPQRQGQALTPKMAPMNQPGAAAPQAAPEQSAADKVKELFPTLQPARSAYSSNPDEMTNSFAGRFAGDRGEIEKNYKPALDQALTQAQAARAEGNAILNELRNLPSAEEIMQDAHIGAERIADQQEQNYHPFQSMFRGGRLPAELMDRSERVGQAAGSIYQAGMAARKQKIEELKVGLDYAANAMKDADNTYTDLLARKNSDITNARIMDAQLYGNQNQYSKGIDTQQRGQIGLGIAAKKAEDEHKDRIAGIAAKAEIATKMAELAFQRLQVSLQNATTGQEKADAYREAIQSQIAEKPIKTANDQMKAFAAVMGAGGLAMLNQKQKDEYNAMALQTIQDAKHQSDLIKAGQAAEAKTKAIKPKALIKKI